MDLADAKTDRKNRFIGRYNEVPSFSDLIKIWNENISQPKEYQFNINSTNGEGKTALIMQLQDKKIKFLEIIFLIFLGASLEFEAQQLVREMNNGVMESHIDTWTENVIDYDINTSSLLYMIITDQVKIINRAQYNKIKSIFDNFLLILQFVRDFRSNFLQLDETTKQQIQELQQTYSIPLLPSILTLPLPEYNEGQAVVNIKAIIQAKLDKYNTKLNIFERKLPGGGGGAPPGGGGGGAPPAAGFKKYLKYKAKYLQLKNQLN